MKSNLFRLFILLLITVCFSQNNDNLNLNPLVKNYKEKMEKVKKNNGNFVVFLDSTITISRKNDVPIVLMFACNNRGILYDDQGDYKNALSYYLEGLNASKKIKNLAKQADLLGNIGTLYYNIRNYKKFLEYNKASMEIHQKLNNKRGLALNYSCLGMYYSFAFNNKYDEALKNYEIARKISIEEKDNDAQITYEADIAGIKFDKKDYNGALKDYLYLYKASSNSEDSYTVSMILLNLGATYTKLNQPNEALVYLEKFKKNQEKTNSKYELEYYHLYLSEAYALKKDIKKSLAERDLYQTIRDSLNDLEKTAQIANTEAKYKTNEQKQTIVNQQKSISVLQQITKNYLWFTLPLMFGLGFVVFWFRKKKKESEIQRQLLAEENIILSENNSNLKQKLLKLAKKYETENKPLFENENNKKDEQKTLTTTEREASLKTILDYLEVEKPYLKPDLTIENLAQNLKFKKHTLSEVINLAFGKNFSGLINIYRVDTAKKILLQDDKNLTMLAVAYDSGFNSKSSFYRIFKEIVGITPAEFKENQFQVA